MRRGILLVVLCAITVVGCGPRAVETDDYQTTMLLLPEGEAAAGREVFVSIGCASCHTVAWDADLPAPTSDTPGPELGVDLGGLGLGGLATSIVAPSHKVAEKYRTAENRSPMRDFTRIMTIRQLADVVAYLARQGLETQAKTGQGAPG